MEPADAARQDVADINACGLALRTRYGFPDPQCPVESPMAELDGAVLAMPAEPAPADVAGSGDAGTATGTTGPAAGDDAAVAHP